jgi:hypothetical protein
MKKLLTMFIVMSGVLGAQALSPQLAEAAAKKISNVVTNHPDSLVSHDLSGWLKEKRVVFAPTTLLPGLSSSAERTAKGSQIRLWYDPYYVLDPPFTFDPAEKKALLQLEVYHEAVYISEHIHGRYKLQAMKERSTGSPMAEGVKLWEIEWTVMRGKWALAKKLGMQRLLPVMNKAMAGGENPRTFLEGFYNLRMQVEAKTRPEFGPIFTAIYQHEKARISLMYR